MPDTEDLLDRLPTGPIEAAAWLRQLQTIATNAELSNTAKRLGALARWAERIGKADEALLILDEPDDRGAAAFTDRLDAIVGPSAPARGRMQPKGVLHAQIVDFVTRRGPSTFPEIASALPKATRTALKRALAELVAVKQITQAGRSRGTRYRVPTVSARPPSTSTAPARSSHVPTSPAGPGCKICDCPFKDHDPTTGKCYGKDGKCICTEFRK